MESEFTLQAYNFELPRESIAQHPAEKRDHSKLLVVNKDQDATSHHRFADIINFFQKGDVLVLNDTKVFPARLHGKKESGGKVEIFLLHFPNIIENGKAHATALLKSSRRPQPGAKIIINEMLHCQVINSLDNAEVAIEIIYPEDGNLATLLEDAGQVPLPPYISREEDTQKDKERYQTVYANNRGAVAAPTAGLHFTPELLEAIENKGVQVTTITLHVGFGTFAPVRTEDITSHSIHQEYITVDQQAADHINAAKSLGGKIWAVGTTTVRTLEFVADQDGKLSPFSGWCDLYIIPGYHFKVIDCMVTNFHLPRSSLLFLVSAFCGREQLLYYYNEAIAEGYRFYSYGDAMLIR